MGFGSQTFSAFWRTAVRGEVVQFEYGPQLKGLNEREFFQFTFAFSIFHSFVMDYQN